MINIKYLKYVSQNGNYIELGNNTTFLMVGLSGIGTPSINIASKEVPFIDGSFVSNIRMEKRNIVITGKIIASGEENMLNARRKMELTFRPKEQGRLYYYVNLPYSATKEFFIDCFVEKGFDADSTKSATEQSFVISLLCPNPFWKTVQESKAKSLANYTGYFEFPFESLVDGGFTFSTFDTNKTYINTGDIPTPITVTFDGLATNPYITNLTTNETLKVNKVIAEDEKLVITTAEGNKTVTIIKADGTKENAFNYIDLSSVFFKFISGENVVTYGSDDSETSGVIIEYTNSFLGV